MLLGADLELHHDAEFVCLSRDGETVYTKNFLALLKNNLIQPFESDGIVTHYGMTERGSKLVA